MPSLMRDIKSTLLPMAAAPVATATAGSTGDATLVNGTAIDVTALTTPGGSVLTPAIESNCRYESVVFYLVATAVLANTKSLTVTALIETSAASNMGSPTTLVSTATVISYVAGSSTTFQLVGSIGCSLEMAKQYVRVSFTPDLSNTTTDTSDIQVVAVFGGPQETP